MRGKIYDFHGDLCHCNWCDKLVVVPIGEDTCPLCDKTGYLMDVEQDVTVYCEESTLG